jgi:mevalonate kinase
VVSASAPAKIILFGEHAVVYGQPAIAVPVSSLRATATVERRNRDGCGIKIVTTDFASAALSEVKTDIVDEALALTTQLVSQKVGIPTLDITISVHSDIPIASGLGSGAAVSTAIARALAISLEFPLDNETLSQLVYEVEKLHHGTPSGIDNTVVVYEQPVYFVRGHPIESITIAKPFQLLIADSGRGALTRVAVADVRKLYETNPNRIQPILEAIGSLVLQARDYITAGMTNLLGPLMLENHRLLQQLTVSSPELDTLVGAAMEAGALGAKLSGGGRGGNIIALVSEQTLNEVEKAFKHAGAARVISTVVGGREC